MTGARGTAGRDADVAVVGAGPAGSSLALRLARAGVDVVLLDARSFPRSKPCGDCLSPGATPLLRELDVLSAVEELGPGRLGGWRVRSPGGTWFAGRFDPGRGRGPAAGLSLTRRELDAALLDGARREGARVRDRTRAVGLLRERGRADGLRVRDGRGRERELRARFVVGADGLRSTVARELGGVRRGPRRRIALVRRVRAPRGPDRTGELRLGRDGVLGLAPVGGDRYNLTLVVPRSAAPAVSRSREEYFRRRVRGYVRRGWSEEIEPVSEIEITGPFEVKPERLVAPGALLVGDAAGYFDPLTGQGIYRALATSRLAARSVLRGLEEPAREAAALQRYRGEARRLLSPGRRVQRWVDSAVSRPRVIDALARVFAARPSLPSLLFEVTGDRLPARALVRPDRLARAVAAREPGPGARPDWPRGPEGPASAGSTGRRSARASDTTPDETSDRTPGGA